MVDVIPVIDVRHGVVVRAVAGDRANYQPIVSPLFAGCQPSAAVSGLMALHAFSVIYVADLDGIEGRGSGSMGLADQLLNVHPGVELWADCGCRATDSVEALLTLDRVRAVIGSETGVTAAELNLLKIRFGDKIVLSLDFRGDDFVGDPVLLARPEVWPNRVIVMTLGSVGRNGGPDYQRLRHIAALAPHATLYAAGGVRDGADLSALTAMGISGVLVSSALHAQTITADDLG